MNNKTVKPTRCKFTILRQICNLIPAHLVPQIARQTKVDEQARTFGPWSHVVALLHAQLSHSIGLNDVCDSLQLRAGPLSARSRTGSAPGRHAARPRSCSSTSTGKSSRSSPG